VTAATKEYLEGQDATALWVEENIEFQADSFTPIASIGASYREWCEKRGRQAQDINVLVDELIANYSEQNLQRDRQRVAGRLQRGLIGVRIVA